MFFGGDSERNGCEVFHLEHRAPFRRRHDKAPNELWLYRNPFRAECSSDEVDVRISTPLELETDVAVWIPFPSPSSEDKLMKATKVCNLW